MKCTWRRPPLSLKNLSLVVLDLFQLRGGAAREEGGLGARGRHLMVPELTLRRARAWESFEIHWKSFQNLQNPSKIFKNPSKMFKIFKTLSKSSKPFQNLQNPSEILKIFPKPSKPCQNLPRIRVGYPLQPFPVPFFQHKRKMVAGGTPGVFGSAHQPTIQA